MVTAAALGVFLLDWAIVSPLLASRDELAGREAMLRDKIDDGYRLQRQSRLAARQLRQWHNESLPTDGSASERKLLSLLGEWARQEQLSLSSIRPDRGSQAHGLHEVTFQASGEGPMRAVARFLHRIESAPMPLRIREVQIASRSDGADDLTVQLRVSTLWDQNAPPAEPVTPMNAQTARSEP